MIPIACLLRGKPFTNAFRVRLDKDDFICDLKDQVKEKLRPALDNIVASHLTIYKVSISNENLLHEVYRKLGQKGHGIPELKWRTTISDNFPDPADESLYVIIQPPDVASPSPGPTFGFGDDITRRTETVRKLFELVVKQRVVHIRGTPTSGKTILSRLLCSHVEEAHPEYTALHVTWMPIADRTENEKPWKNFICRRSGGRVQPQSFMTRSDVIVILDEAQLSYATNDQSIWIECIKNQAQSSFGPHFAIFSSFGSASSTVLEVAGSAPVTLESSQRISLIPQPDSPHDLSLCFTPEEVMDISESLIGKRGFALDPDALVYLFIQTDGHPGLTDALLRGLFDYLDVRLVIMAGGRITLDHVSDFLSSDDDLFTSISARVRRSIPDVAVLSRVTNKDLVQSLKRAIQERGIEAWNLVEDTGLDKAYRMGYLHASFYDPDSGKTLYEFPTLLHHRAVERIIYPDDDDAIQFSTLKDLCFAALEEFSPASLTPHKRRGGSIGRASRQGAQYGYELFRCLYKVTGGECIVHGEYSHVGNGRLDFFLKKKKWGIEISTNGDRMDEHVNRFGAQGRYGSWGIVTEHILLDFRITSPNKKRDIPELFHVVFNKSHDEYRVMDSNHNVVIDDRLLLHG